jgi:hypothetical protein
MEVHAAEMVIWSNGQFRYLRTIDLDTLAYLTATCLPLENKIPDAAFLRHDERCAALLELMRKTDNPDGPLGEGLDRSFLTKITPIWEETNVRVQPAFQIKRGYVTIQDARHLAECTAHFATVAVNISGVAATARFLEVVLKHKFDVRCDRRVLVDMLSQSQQAGTDGEVLGHSLEKTIKTSRFCS